jgi:hypothetical protein
MAVKTQQFLLLSTTAGLHVVTPLSHHQALQWTDPRLFNSWCTILIIIFLCGTTTQCTPWSPQRVFTSDSYPVCFSSMHEFQEFLCLTGLYPGPCMLALYSPTIQYSKNFFRSHLIISKDLVSRLCILSVSILFLCLGAFHLFWSISQSPQNSSFHHFYYIWLIIQLI